MYMYAVHPVAYPTYSFKQLIHLYENWLKRRANSKHF